jgi:hypothetical protein
MTTLKQTCPKILLLTSTVSLFLTGCFKAPGTSGKTSSTDSRVSSITTGVGRTDAADQSIQSRFECKDYGNGRYRPYYLQAIDGSSELKDYSQTPKGLLGQNAMKSLEECNQALQHANHKYGVICSRTGLDGWKPTLYTGTVPGRADFGYLGGSSIMKFEDCLKSTAASSEKGVCYWGGSAWFAGRIDRQGNSIAGPFNSVDTCIEATKAE